jgi:glycosyltransferase involved in cell wall biosynthesis
LAREITVTGAANRPLRLAVHGILAEGVASSAGAYPLLMAALLERGHQVEFFGNPGYVRPRSLERFPNYRFHPLRVEAAEVLWARAAALPTEYPRAIAAQFAHAAYQRETLRRLEAIHASDPYDLLLYTDLTPLLPAKLPVIAWPQGPPQTEAQALRTSDVAKPVLQTWGVGYYAAVQAYYAYRALSARLGLASSDVYLCGSRWARDAWRRFGARPDRVHPLAYPIDLAAFARTQPLGAGRETTFLWLGRAVPRKRLDLFLGGFARLRARRAGVRARIVGSIASDPFGRATLERYGAIPDLTVEEPVPRERVADLFGATDVLVQPSQSENFGFSLAEALASGRAVVGGPTNGTFEYAGDAGFGFSEYTPEAVADAMERALDAISENAPLVSERARAAARYHFDIEAVTDRFCAVCAELIGRRVP